MSQTKTNWFASSTHHIPAVDDGISEFDLFQFEREEEERTTFLGAPNCKMITLLQGIAGQGNMMAMKIEGNPATVACENYDKFLLRLEKVFNHINDLESEFFTV